MGKKQSKPWVNDATASPRISGHLEISTTRTGVFIAGDPTGLRALAKLLTWLANVDQESLVAVPDGERCHVHLHAFPSENAARSLAPFASLTRFSAETEICRLDAKGTGEFPDRYREGTSQNKKFTPQSEDEQRGE